MTLLVNHFGIKISEFLKFKIILFIKNYFKILIKNLIKQHIDPKVNDLGSTLSSSVLSLKILFLTQVFTTSQLFINNI